MYFSNVKNVSKEEKLFTFLVVLMAWANVYSFPGIPLGLGEFFLIIFIPFYSKRDMDFSLKRYEQGFIYWLVYTTIVTLILLNYIEAPLYKFFSAARVFFYWILIFVFGKNFFNIDYFKKWMVIFCILLSGFIILQSFVYLIIGVYIPGLLNIPLNYGDADSLHVLAHRLSLADWKGFIRPSGFLIEPADCVQYLFVCLIVFITDCKLSLKNKFLLSLFISFSILLTYSSTGIVLLFFSWGAFVIINKHVYNICFFGIICVFFLIAANLSNTENDAMIRIINVLNGESIDSSSNTRLYNGFEHLKNLPIILQLCGTGIGFFEFILDRLGFVYSSSFKSSFSGIFFMSGFVGFLIWNISLIKNFLYSKLLGKTLSVGFFILSIGCSVFCQPIMVWIFLLIFADIKTQQNMVKEII